MKKIIFFMSLVVTASVFSQELLTNGDFETGTAAPWTGNAANVVDQGGNFVNEANILAAGNAFDVNLSQNLPLENGKTYEFSFDAFTDTATASRTMIVGIGEAGDDFEAVIETSTLTDVLQNFSYELTANFSDVTNSRVLFDMGAETGFVFIDNVSLIEVTGTPSGPTVGAPTPPARPEADVYSIYSDAYTNVTVDQWGPDWGPESARINEVEVDGNNTRVVDMQSGLLFAGIDFSISSPFDATDFTTFHMDYWIDSPLPAGQVLNTKLSNHDGGAGETSAIQDTQTPTAGEWVSLDIALDDFVEASAPPNLDRNAIAQIVLTAARADLNNALEIFIDNIYFHKGTVLGVDSFEEITFDAYPNPTNDSWNIRTNGQNITSINVIDVAGRQVFSVLGSGNTTNIDASALPSGVYFATITSNSVSKTIRLIKK